MAEIAKKTEIVAVPPKAGGAIQPFIPKTPEELKWTAGMIISGGLAPDSYGNDIKKITLAIMKGLEVGLPPMAAVNGIAIINGRPCIYGDAATALVQSKGLIRTMKVEQIGPKLDEAAETGQIPDGFGYRVRIWRQGQDDPYEGQYTVGDAKRAKLWMNPKRQPWMLHPKRMLKIRGTSFPLRDGFADALMGLYIAEEIEDLPPPPPDTHDVTFLDDAPPPDGEDEAMLELEAPAEEPEDSPAREAVAAESELPGAEDYLRQFKGNLSNAMSADEADTCWEEAQKYLPNFGIKPSDQMYARFATAWGLRKRELEG